MESSDFTANVAQLSRLKNNIENGKLAHAYIFEGSKRADKLGFAHAFVAEVIGGDIKNHPDVLEISHEGITIKNEELTLVQEKLMTAPMLANYNIVIIDGADSITPRAQNRMLKTLEEPRTDSIIILLSENSQNLLPTVRSRCLTVRLNDMPYEKSEETLKTEAMARQLLTDVQNGEPFYKLMKTYENAIAVKQDAYVMLDAMQEMLSTIFVEAAISGGAEVIADAIEAIQRANRDLRIGVNPSYAMKNLIIKLEDIL